MWEICAGIEVASGCRELHSHVTRSGLVSTRPQDFDGLSTEQIRALRLRFFTPREIANLHSFPAAFSFPAHITLRQRYALLGNSLSALVVADLLRYLLHGSSHVRDLWYGPGTPKSPTSAAPGWCHPHTWACLCWLHYILHEQIGARANTFAHLLEIKSLRCLILRSKESGDHLRLAKSGAQDVCKQPRIQGWAGCHGSTVITGEL